MLSDKKSKCGEIPELKEMYRKKQKEENWGPKKIGDRALSQNETPSFSSPLYPFEWVGLSDYPVYFWEQ